MPLKSRPEYSLEGVKAFQRKVATEKSNSEWKYPVIPIDLVHFATMLRDMERGWTAYDRMKALKKALGDLANDFDGGMTAHGDIQTEGDAVRALLKEFGD